MPDQGALRESRRRLQDEVARLRSLSRWQAGQGLVWACLALARWASDDGGWLAWAWSALALTSIGAAVVTRRRRGRAEVRLAERVGLDLRPLTEATLSRVVAAALSGAAADEVTPSVTPGEGWTPDRIEWLRAYHRDRRSGLDGEQGEATWAVVDVSGAGADDERVVGAVRLRRSGEPGVLETVIWLTREARGRGIGRQGMRLVLDRARDAGASVVRADTTTGNAGAAALLRSLGFTTEVQGETVRAELDLRP